MSVEKERRMGSSGWEGACLLKDSRKDLSWKPTITGNECEYAFRDEGWIRSLSNASFPREENSCTSHTYRMEKLYRNEVGLVVPRKTHQPDQQLRMLFVECVDELH